MKKASIFTLTSLYCTLALSSQNPYALEKTSSTETPLLTAALFGQVEMVRLLIEAGVKLNPHNLALIKEEGDQECVQLIQKSGAVAQNCSDNTYEALYLWVHKSGYTHTPSPLLIAARTGHADIVKMLLRTGVTLSLSALIEVIESGHEECVNLIVQAGAITEKDEPRVGRVVFRASR